jgi:REP-associated tyrosine transposase
MKSKKVLDDMARSWRIEYAGAFYHILSRGNQKQNIFADIKDQERFLDIIGEMATRFDIAIFAYVLLENHYHILLKTRSPNLSKAMQWMGTTYTRIYNNRHNRAGHLFQGRYKSFVVENDAYLLQLSYYIHCNPFRAGLVNRLSDYRWSSYPIYAYAKKGPEWLSTDLIWSFYKGEAPHISYRRKVQSYAKEQPSALEDLHYGLFYGAQSFADQLKERFLKAPPSKETPQQLKLAKDTSAEALIGNIFNVINCDITQFKQALRISKGDCYKRDLVLYLLWHSGLFSNFEIGEMFGLSYSSVSKRAAIMRQRIKEDSNLRDEIVHLNTLIKV